MLTGRKAFPGNDVSDILAAILSADVDLTALPNATPAPIPALLRYYLEKDQIMAVAVKPGPTFQPAEPRALFEARVTGAG